MHIRRKILEKQPQIFTTIDEQINILKKRGLIINNEEFAKSALLTYGYYDLINGYKEPYVIKEDKIEFYKEGTTFEQIFSFFTFDHSIKNYIMLSLMDLEEHLRAITSYVIAEAFTSNHAKYLKPNNYRDRRNSKFNRHNILRKMNDALNSDKDPIKYNRETYGNVPPWVLFKGIYMSTLFNFIKLQKAEQKENIIAKAYNIDKQLAKEEEIKNIFTDSLILFLDYRNLAAHGGRIYNYKPKNDISINSKTVIQLSKICTSAQQLKDTYGLNRLLILLSLFNHGAPYKNLSSAIASEIFNHISVYPKDTKIILDATGIPASNLYFYSNNSKITLDRFLNGNGEFDVNLLQVQKEVASTNEI